MAVVPHRGVGTRGSGHRPRHVGVDTRVLLPHRQRLDDAGAVARREPGPACQRELGAGEPPDRGHPHRPAQLGLDLGHQQVQLAAPALEAATGLLGRAGDPRLGDHDRHEVLGPHRGLGEAVRQVGVDLLGERGSVGAAVPVDPQLPLGAVLRNGADEEEDLVDLLGAAGDVDQPGQRLPVAAALLGVLHADARVDDRGGDRPRLGGVVLDDRDPLQLRAVRRSVVDLDTLQDAGQVRGVEVLDSPRGGLGPERRPAHQPADGVQRGGHHPAGGRAAADRDDGDRPARTARPGRTGTRRTRRRG